MGGYANLSVATATLLRSRAPKIVKATGLARSKCRSRLMPVRKQPKVTTTAAVCYQNMAASILPVRKSLSPAVKVTRCIRHRPSEGVANVTAFRCCRKPRSFQQLQGRTAAPRKSDELSFWLRANRACRSARQDNSVLLTSSWSPLTQSQDEDQRKQTPFQPVLVLNFGAEGAEDYSRAHCRQVQELPGK